MRVLIADDSAFMRQALARAIGETGGLEVVGRAKNGKEAVELATQLKPDAISLDIEMPEMDGLTALRHIMRACPTRVLMCSSLTTAGSVQSLQALRMGAADVIAKENGATLPGGKTFHEEYVRRLQALAESSIEARQVKPEIQTKTNQNSGPAWTPPRIERLDLIAIGSSTGGPPVLETLLTALPANLPVPVVVAQHMPRIFTQSMAERLNDVAPLPVVHAEHGTPLRPGQVYVCPGGEHAHVVRYAQNQLRLKVGPEPTTDLYYPSVDALFHSIAEATGARTLAFILTGIGEDGSKGAKTLRDAGGHIVAQDRASSVVYGMPRSVAERGLASTVMSPDQMAALLGELATKAAA
ncbi:MAG: chemotaxis response regulator protein-glutamate methylesterase [Planctomycetota bacterium]